MVMNKILRVFFVLSFLGVPIAWADSCQWEKLSLSEEFEARDSSGWAYLNGNMILIGGWKNSDEPNLRSIISIDEKGLVTKSVASDMESADLPVSVVYQNKIYVISGWKDGRLNTATSTSSVHVSSDGLNFKYLGEGNFPPKVGAAGVVFKDKIYIIGGTREYHLGDNSSYLNDVWSSIDGISYQLEKENAEFSARAFHQAFVFDNKLCVAGGGGYLPTTFTKNDIWCSKNGKDFTEINPHADWEPRIWFGSFVYAQKAYVLGGDSLVQRDGENVNKLLNDVWESDDLLTWKRLSFERVWSPRHAFTTVLAEDQERVYVAAGHAKPLTNDVWYLNFSRNSE